jgi:hypothetical protein
MAHWERALAGMWRDVKRVRVEVRKVEMCSAAIEKQLGRDEARLLRFAGKVRTA